MKRIFILVVVVCVAVNIGVAQFKSQEETKSSVVSSLIHPAAGMSGLLSWFNPENFIMHHSFSFQYMSTGGYGLSTATYTNSMFYKIADPLDVRFDVSLQGSPFGQYGAGQQSDFSRLFLSRAELNYRPWENVRIQFQYMQFPYSFYSPWYSPSPLGRLGDE